MSLFDYFRRSGNNNTASTARERLQVIVAHQRAERSQPEYLPKMQQEILAVIRKYVNVEQDQVTVQMDNIGDCSVLELNVTLPK